ncbi:group 1 glycosyl transferase, partial [Desulfobacteraceae bacterium SEEP-SAG9]
RDINDIYRIMDFLVLPSLTEGLPNVVLESFAMAKPVVATSVGGVPEIVVNKENGILVPPGRPDMLADGIKQLIESKEMRYKFGIEGYKKVNRDFSFTSQKECLENIYQTIILGDIN